MNVPFFPWLLPSRTRLLTERVANIQDQVVELGTHVRFMEADKRVPQPRDELSGRYVSKRNIIRSQLEEYARTTTQEQRKAEFEADYARRRQEARGVGR